MAVYFIEPGRHHRRPNVRSLNKDCPLTYGLQNYWPMVSHTGHIDLARTNVSLVPSSGHAWVWRGQATLGNSNYIAAAGNSVFTTGLANISAPWTWHMWWHRIATGLTASIFTNDTSGNNYGVRGEQFGGSGAIGYSSAAGGNQFLTGITAPTTKATAITYVQPTSGNMEIYFDGVLQGTLAATNPALTLGKIGNLNATLDRPPLGWWGGIGVWNRALSYGEVYSLFEPDTRWDLEWEPTHRATFFITSGAGRTTKNTRSHPLGINIGAGWRMTR